jgi:hypothetical protein
MSETMNDPDGYDQNEEELFKEDLDEEYTFPSAERLMQIAASMEYYDTEHNVGARKAIKLVEDQNLPEKFIMANALCDEFARMEQTVQNPGLTMMLYEGMIFKTMWDLRSQTISRNGYKELSRFFMVGCGVLLALSIYLLATK